LRHLYPDLLGLANRLRAAEEDLRARDDAIGWTARYSHL
jgi:hypothetical protein